MPWVLAAAAVTVGGGLLAANNASNAADKAAAAQQAGAAEATAEQRRQFDLIQQETAPGRQVGNAAIGALGSSFGLPGYGNGTSMTGGTTGAPAAGSQDPYYGYAISRPASGPSTVSMTGATPPTSFSRAPGASGPDGGPPVAPAKSGSAGVSPAVPDTGAGVRLGGLGGIPQTYDRNFTPTPMNTGGDDFGGGAPGTISGGPPGGGPAVGATPSQSGSQEPDWEAYLAANPDVKAWAESGHGDPNSDIAGQSIQQRAAYHFYNSGQDEGRQLPMRAGPAQTPTQTGAGTPAGPAPGYNDPTAPNGYTAGPRPTAGPAPATYAATQRPDAGPAPARQDLGPGPGAYTAAARQDPGSAPTRMTMGPLDVSQASFHTSPGYQFRVNESNKSLDNLSSSMGGVLSGARVKAAIQRSGDLADQDYTSWRDYTTNQYNLDRSRGDQVYGQDLGEYNLNRTRGDQLYADDRNFGYGQSRDARGDYVVDRSRGDALHTQDLGQYNTDRARSDGLYSEDRQFDYGQSRDARGDYTQDRARTDGLYQDDRNYMTSRYDTRNAQLMGLAGIGTGATNTSAGAAQSFATNVGNNVMTGANATANGYINGANAFTSAVNNISQVGGYLAGRYMTTKGG